MVYKLGHWKKSTLRTLERVRQENDDFRRNLQASILKNGSMAKWLTILKEGEYLDNGDGYKLNDKGRQLLQELRETISLKKKSKQEKTALNITHNKIQNGFVLKIQGEGLDIENKINGSQEKIINALNAFHRALNET